MQRTTKDKSYRTLVVVSASSGHCYDNVDQRCGLRNLPMQTGPTLTCGYLPKINDEVPHGAEPNARRFEPIRQLKVL
jgi:hypothetical protein